MIEEEIATMLDEDVLDEAGKCTKVTKKASSTSKGKSGWSAWRTPTEKDIKEFTGDKRSASDWRLPGNTKRKKSFRARHGCSKAKPGTAKYQACKDW